LLLNLPIALPCGLACGKRPLLYTHVPMNLFVKRPDRKKYAGGMHKEDIQIACPFMRATRNIGFGLVIPLAYADEQVGPDIQYMTH
jgi:hypothetical protein